jgi:hypothetical protein
MAGSIGVRQPGAFLMSGDSTFGTMAEDEIVELKDYDPVRKTSIVIGLKEPTTYVPLHWLALRTHPGKNVSLLLFREAPPKGVPVFSSKILHGSFDEAMEIVKALKASKKDAIFLEGRGLLLMAKELKGLASGLTKVFGKAQAKKRTKGQKKGPATKRKCNKKGPSKAKPRTSKKKTHYKRGPTRRRSKRRT